MLVMGRKVRELGFWKDAFFVVVFETVVPNNCADRMDRGPADLAGPFCDIVRHSEDLLSVLVKQQMVIAEVRPAHVPVEVLGLEVEREYIRKQLAERIGDLSNRSAAEAGGYFNHPAGRICEFSHVAFSHSESSFRKLYLE